MIKKIKFFNVIFVIFLVISSSLVITSESKIVEKQQKITNQKYASSETSKIEIYQYLKNGSLYKSSEIVTTEQANNLILSLNSIATEKKPIHKQIDLAIQELKEIIDFNESLINHIVDPDRNFFGLCFFVGFGLSIMMGLHGYQTPLGFGTHLLGLFSITGVCRMKGGTQNDLTADGVLFGITIGYFGFLMRVMVPNINGIFILGIGASLFTSWREM